MLATRRTEYIEKAPWPNNNKKTNKQHFNRWNRYSRKLTFFGTELNLTLKLIHILNSSGIGFHLKIWANTYVTVLSAQKQKQTIYLSHTSSNSIHVCTLSISTHVQIQSIQSIPSTMHFMHHRFATFLMEELDIQIKQCLRRKSLNTNP